MELRASVATVVTREPFVIARGTEEEVEVIRAAVTHDGVTGYGEGAPHAEEVRRDGRFRRLKLKLGGGDGLDVERVRAVRQVTTLPLLVDANEAWASDDEALEVLGPIARLAIDACEQPLPVEAMLES